jgi:FKBP-type peptidyl-prolyl cis-trans isomerase 2
MTKAKHGDRVRVHYTGSLDDGTLFDSSRERAPLEFTLGDGQLIKGFELAVDGMSSGETKTVTIPAVEAYGPHREELVNDLPRSKIPPEIELNTGLQLEAQNPDGQSVRFVVAAFDAETVTLDGNHPLAGQDLTFEIEVVEILSAA